MKEMVRIMGSGRDSEHGLSPLKTFIFTAARSVGVGNIAGMAAALFTGGSGIYFLAVGIGTGRFFRSLD